MDSNAQTPAQNPLPQPNPVVEPQSPAPTGKLNKFVILVFIVALILGSGGTYLVLNSQSKKALPAPSPIPEISQTPSPTSDLTTNWKSYTFQPLQLSLKVPSELTVHQEEPNPGQDFTAYIQNYAFNAPLPKENAYQLYIIWQKTQKITDAEFQQLKNELNPSSIEETSIDGYPAIKGQINGERNRYVTYILRGGNKISLFTSQPTQTNKELTDQILSTFKFSPTNNSSSVPSDWTSQTSIACNVIFSIPPKKAPYYTPDDPTTSPDTAEDGAFWQFQENKGEDLFKNASRVTFLHPKVMGSGYVPGMVSANCSSNDGNYTSESLLQKYRSNFENGTYTGLEIINVKNVSLWGKKVYAVYIKGGMSDELNPGYLFATEKHIYLVNKIAMSSSSFVKETTEIIFNSLRFND